MSNSTSETLGSDREPPLPLQRRPRAWIAAVVGAAIAVTAVAGIAALINGANTDEDGPQNNVGPAGPGPGSPSPGQGAVEVSDLVVRDGDEVEAEGLLIVPPGQPAELCPVLPVVSIDPPPPPSCSGFGFEATGVDLDLVGGEVRDGIFVASVRFRGIYHSGRQIQIVEIEPAAPPVEQPEGDIRQEPPCDPPPGGWQASDDHATELDELTRYVSAHSDRFNGLRVVYPPSATWDPADISYDVEVYVVGVAAGDPQEALEELRSNVGANVCTVAVSRTVDEDRGTEAAIQRLADDQASGIYSFGSGSGFEPMRVDILVLDERMYGELGAIGFENLDVRPWLAPA